MDLVLCENVSERAAQTLFAFAAFAGAARPIKVKNWDRE